MPRFEDILNECLEGLRSGRLTAEECLVRYPQWAGELAPLLKVAAALDHALKAEADPTFQVEGRRRLLNSVAARRLAAAPASARRWLWAPSFRLRAFVSQPVMSIALAFVVGFAGFSSYAVVTSGGALPGDWRYPIKRTSERVRLAFAFDEGARRGLRISFAEERLREVQDLASSQRSISEPVLRDLVRTTDSLGKSLDPVSVSQQDVQRIGELAQKQQEVLPAVKPLVEAKAADDLQAALESSEKVYALALAAGPLAEGPPGSTPPAGATPGPSATPGGGATPAASVTPEGGGTPSPTETPAGSVASPTRTAMPPSATEEPEPTPTPATVSRRTAPLPEDQTAGLAWSQVTVGDFSVVVPSDPAWVVSFIGSVSSAPDPAREMVLVGHRGDGVFAAVVLIQEATGEATVQAPVGGAMTAIPVDDVARLLPLEAPVIQHILESVRVGPP